jgi:hypothetical protein
MFSLYEYSILCLYRTWLYRNTYISFLVPEDLAKLNSDNLYESRDSYTGTLFMPGFCLSRLYKIFLSGINREYCLLYIFRDKARGIGLTSGGPRVILLRWINREKECLLPKRLIQ